MLALFPVVSLICACFACTQVREVALEAIARARAGEGPTLIECETYRFRWVGHWLSSWGSGHSSRPSINKWQATGEETGTSRVRILTIAVATWSLRANADTNGDGFELREASGVLVSPCLSPCELLLQGSLSCRP
jgi:hypothetical protein